MALSACSLSSVRISSGGVAQTSGYGPKRSHTTLKRTIRCSGQERPAVTNAFGQSRHQSPVQTSRASTKTNVLTLGSFSETSRERNFILEELAADVASLPGRAWSSYCRALGENPLPTKAIVMALGLALGDVFAQFVTTGAASNLARTMHMAVFGLVFQGPALHFLHSFMEARIQPETPTSKSAVLSKVMIDQGMFAPVAIAVFISFMQIVGGNSSVAAIGQALQSTLLPTIKANYLVWPAALLINYAVIPAQHRILFVNVITVMWSAILSVIV